MAWLIDWSTIVSCLCSRCLLPHFTFFSSLNSVTRQWSGTRPWHLDLYNRIFKITTKFWLRIPLLRARERRSGHPGHFLTGFKWSFIQQTCRANYCVQFFQSNVCSDGWLFRSGHATRRARSPGLCSFHNQPPTTVLLDRLLAWLIDWLILKLSNWANQTIKCWSSTATVPALFSVYSLFDYTIIVQVWQEFVLQNYRFPSIFLKPEVDWNLLFENSFSVL